MASKYTAKEIKELIGKYDKAFNDLLKSRLYVSDFREKADRSRSYAHMSDMYLRKLSKDLQIGCINNDDKFKDLLLDLYLELKAEELMYSYTSLALDNREKLAPYISNAKKKTNPLVWLFTSKKNKEETENDVSFLYDYLSSTLFSEAEECHSNFESLKTLSYADVETDCLRSLEQLKKRAILDDRYGENSDRETQIANVLNKVYGLNESKKAIGLANDKLRENVKSAVDRLVAEELISTLRGISIDELNRSKAGIRVKTIRDAGYLNMADVFVASIENISSIYGVSWNMACDIKRVANDFGTEAQKGIKIKLTSDNKTKTSTKVVIAVASLLYLRSKLDSVTEFDEKYEPSFSEAYERLESLEGGLDYCFGTDDFKEQILQDYKFLSDLSKTKYQKAFNEIVAFSKKNKAISSQDAWALFNTNSIQFYNIIEEICPGVLGTDDSVYGLPEDLAREIQDECFFPDGLLCTLRRYQEWGVKYILHQEKTLLGDEMGLGKTIQAIAAMVSLKNTGATHFAVVCPASVVTNWCREIGKHSRLKYLKVHGQGKNDCIKAWLKNGGVAVTTYETAGLFLSYEGYKIDMLVVDEAHYIKNENALRSRNVRKLCILSKRLLFMTGTALENKVDEMISLIDVLNPSIGQDIKSIAYMPAAASFRAKIAPVYYRRKRTDVLTELPDLIANEEWCEMSPEEEKRYEYSLLNEHYMQVRRVSWNVPNIKDSCKAKRMLEIIEEAKHDNRKIIVFSFFLETLRSVFELLGPNQCMNMINGSVKPNKRQEILDEFENAPAGTVLPAQIQSGGTGLNIQAASVVIICEPQLKPSIENQAISRAYRMGQSRNVHVHRLLCAQSIDEKLMDVLQEKQEIFDAFADKSVAAEKTVEIDDKKFGELIKEEIDRINKKNGGKPADITGYEPALKENGKPVSTPFKDAVKETAAVVSNVPARVYTYQEMLNMSYEELCQVLKEKHGPARYDYFNTPQCVSKNQKVGRGREGLQCHHIAENKVINISKPECAIRYDFAYQKKENLVYCNLLEHLLLHVLIAELGLVNSDGNMLGIGGCICILCQINDGYNGYPFRDPTHRIAFEVIKDDFDDYILILKKLKSCIDNNPSYSFSVDEICSGSDGVVLKVRNALTSN